MTRCLYHYMRDKAQGDLDRFQLDWKEIIPYAAQVVEEYNDADSDVNTRQLFYILYSQKVVEVGSYGQLCSYSAAARRGGTFPRLIDLGRSIHREPSWEGCRGRTERHHQPIPTGPYGRAGDTDLAGVEKMARYHS